MSDRDILAALTEFARNIGLMDETWKLAIVPVPTVPEAPRDDALCLAYGKYREVRLLCTYGRGHESAHSWATQMVGKSACIARSHGPEINLLCQRPTHHTGEHKASTPDGARWTWGDVPRDAAAGELGKGCGAWEWGTNGHKAGCILRAGHEGAHRGVDADGKSIFTWPCPCYPDCGGHTVGELCGAKNAAVNPVMAGQVCALLRGHEGSHEATVNGQRWLFGRTDPTEPRAS